MTISPTQATAQHRALADHNDHGRRVSHRFEQARQSFGIFQRRIPALGIRTRKHGAQVGSGAEVALRPPQYNRPQFRQSGNRRKLSSQRGDHLGGQRIARTRPVQGEIKNSVLKATQDGFGTSVSLCHAMVP